MAKNWFRACERRAVSLPARLTIRDAEPSAATLVNLGLSGCCARLPDFIPVGGTLSLELEPANLWDPLKVQCRVVWCETRDDGVFAGLEFALEGPPMMGLLLDLMTADAYE